ncbi:hypothetical protein N3K66_005149 [Trichothecium roseum]|uniref:Uncharacterized protein n=1 Tax=Trichothecium roseum TaxID=47278 RepID=A0ACC0V3L2_9HYPO|nr:hypothetical protein N3K66_005149 [Trichothecium roseum]
MRQYERNFDAFTHGCLAGLDWSNIVVAGSAALLPLLPPRQDVELDYCPSEADPLESYYEHTAGSSDIDIFVHGLGDDEERALKKIRSVEATLRRNQRIGPGGGGGGGGGMALRTANAVTLIAPRWPYRHVQIILRLYASVGELLAGFDVDCACVAFDGSQVWTSPRGAAAIATRTNTVDLSRRSPSYENRLYKYRNHNFDVYWPLLDRSRINHDACNTSSSRSGSDGAGPRNLNGLARLVFFEAALRRRDHHGAGHRAAYRRRRRLKKIDESGRPPAHSGYAAVEVPYGQRYTARRVQKFIAQRSREPHVFGDLETVLEQGTAATGSSRKRDRTPRLQGRVRFLRDDPGRQMVGSFYPLTEDDWTAQAYTPSTT